MTLTEALQTAELFGDLNDEQRALLGRVMVERPMRRGDVLVREGDRPHPVGDALFLLLEGEVSVTCERMDAAGLGPIAVLEPGEFLGVASLFDDSPRAATCVMTRAGRVACLARRTLDALIHSDMAVGAAVELALARQLARDLRMFDRGLEQRMREIEQTGEDELSQH